MLAYAPEMATYVPNPEHDPLAAVPHLLRVREYNDTHDARAILSSLTEVTDHGPAHELEGVYIPGVARQTTADLDTLASSAVRWGADPFRHVPGLGRLMFDLGEIGQKVSGAPEMAARMTLEEYIHPRILPNGEPVMFTGSRGERLFIPVLNFSYYSLRRAVSALSSADLAHDPTDDLVDRLHLARVATMDMLDGTLQAATLFEEDEESGPFGTKFQPFFPELVIEGRSYKPSSGVQSGFSELELLLRAIDADAGPEGDAKMFAEFYNGNVPYLPAHRRSEIIRYADTNRHEDGETPMSFFTYIRDLAPGERRRRLAEAYIGAITADTEFAIRHYGRVRQDGKSRARGFKGGAGKSIEQLRELRNERLRHQEVAAATLLEAA